MDHIVHDILLVHLELTTFLPAVGGTNRIEVLHILCWPRQPAFKVVYSSVWKSRACNFLCTIAMTDSVSLELIRQSSMHLYAGQVAICTHAFDVYLLFGLQKRCD